MSKNEKRKLKVLRVTQLDAQQIDNRVFTLLKDFLVESLKQEPFTSLLHFEPELSACLQLVLWNFSIRKNGKNIGQRMLGTEFVNPLSKEGDLTNRQTYSFVVYILIQWVKNREHFFVNLMRKWLKVNDSDVGGCPIQKMFTYIETASRVLYYINLIAFIQRCDYVSILQRCVQLKHVYTGNPYPRYIDYEYMRKEMVWENVTQTIMCVIPLVNFRRISLFFNSWFARKNRGMESVGSDSLKCGICKEVASNPYQIEECLHIYCYFCLQTNKVNGEIQCQFCGVTSNAFQPVIFKVS